MITFFLYSCCILGRGGKRLLRRHCDAPWFPTAAFLFDETDAPRTMTGSRHGKKPPGRRKKSAWWQGVCVCNFCAIFLRIPPQTVLWCMIGGFPSSWAIRHHGSQHHKNWGGGVCSPACCLIYRQKETQYTIQDEIRTLSMLNIAVYNKELIFFREFYFNRMTKKLQKRINTQYISVGIAVVRILTYSQIAHC